MTKKHFSTVGFSEFSSIFLYLRRCQLYILGRFLLLPANKRVEFSVDRSIEDAASKLLFDSGKKYTE